MELIDSYLTAVTGYLPGDTRDDIREELKSSLYEQLEDQSRTLQRELTEEDQVEFLRKLGHPLKVAGQYLPQQYLIGPGLFPFYKNALKIAAIAVFAFHTVVSIVKALITDDWFGSVADVMANILGTMIFVGAIVTVVFVVMERSDEKANRFYKWDPWSLRRQKNTARASRGDTVSDVIIESVLLLWWNGTFSVGGWFSWEVTNVAVSTPGLDAVFWPVNILLVGSLLLHGVMLISSVWRPGLIALEILFDLAWIGIAGSLLRFNNPIVVDISGDVPLDRIQSGVNLGFQILIWFILIMTMVELIKHIRIGFRVTGNR